MADLDYPTSLPPPLVGTFEEGSTDPWVQDQGEVGAPRRRKRFSRILHQFPFQLRLTGEQKATLLAFYDVTLDAGVEIFNWTHPTTAVVYEVRFASRPRPKHLTVDIWDVDVLLEEV